MKHRDILERNQAGEWDQPITEVTGAIPDDIDGTALRNGPGVLALGVERLAYLDGLGALGGMQFRAGCAHFRSRFVRSELYDEEIAAKAIRARRVFTNLTDRWANFGNFRLGNSANHDVYSWGDDLYVGDVRHLKIDPATFDVESEVTWGEMVAGRRVAGPMPRNDPSVDRLVGYTLTQGPKQVVTFFELDRAHEAVARHSAVIKGFVHDVAFTSNYYIVADNPAKLSVSSAAWGKNTVYDSLRFHDGPVNLIVVNRSSGAVQEVSLPATARTLFHFLNAFEQGDGTIVVDAIGYESPVHFDGIQPANRRAQPMRPQPAPRILRYRISRDDWRCEETHLAGARGEAPEVDERCHGRPYRHAWFVAVPGPDDYDPMSYVFSNVITHLDVEDEICESWSAEPCQLVSQPCFMPRVGSLQEGEGYLAVWVTDVQRESSSMILLDAQAPSKGPIATLALPGYLPPPSHTRFAAGLHISQ